MPISKGIDVQKSRFAALALETSSESEEDGDGEWEKVKKAHKPGAAKPQGQKRVSQDGEGKPLSKNAKKRARKKKQQQALVANEGAAYVGDSKEPEQPQKEPLWQKKNEAVVEQEFQKDLEQAILLSKLEAERHDKIVQQYQATEHMMKAAKASKKGVTMSLQQLHTAKVPAPPDTSAILSDSSDPMMSPVDPEFFTRLGQEVKTELKREKQLERTVEPQSPSSCVEELPRIAQLQDEIEKRDKDLLRYKKENEALKKALKEVKERNKSLCLIMSQGEISSKAKLLQQIEQLTTVKNELTSEVESLHSSLEQERSKSKSLKAELTKLQSSRSGKHGVMRNGD